jgi:N-acetylglucosaminyl-diphospho-decaprenol L-rhamnosyltransferase
LSAFALAIVSHQSARDLPGALASSTGIPRVIVDSASTDGSAALARTLAPDARVIELPSNLGYGAALNRALAVIDCEFVVCANADVVFHAGALEALVRFLETSPAHALAAPLLIDSKGRETSSGRGFPTVALEACELFYGHRLWPENPIHRGYWRDDLPLHQPADAEWLVGACLAARRRAVLAVGGFDEGYHMYFEETDLAWRLARAGWRAAYRPEAVVTHAGGGSSTGQEARLARVYRESQQRFFTRKYGAPAATTLRVVQAAGAVFRSLALSLRCRTPRASGSASGA